jgi:hypothetical protein
MGTLLASLNLKLVAEIAIGVILGNVGTGLLSFLLQAVIELSER